MKNLIYPLLGILLLPCITAAQDEGTTAVKSRFENDKSIYVTAGPALTLGKNLGDYSNGFSLEIGMLKRLNKIVSVGPGVSYLTFKYDTKQTYSHYYSTFDDRTIEFSMEGGDISLLSIGGNVKVNFIPVSNSSKVSVYGIANPFLSLVKRKAFSGSGEFYDDANGNGTYNNFRGRVEFGPEEVPAFKEESKVSGGIHLGAGAEFMPAKALSFFAQAAFSYTLPISYAATRSFLNPADEVKLNNVVYYNADNTVFKDGFPIVRNGFSALSLKAGVSFNF
jgi:hypothetical protein